MREIRRRLTLLAAALAVGCGARTDLEGGAGGGAPVTCPAVPDAGASPTCSGWDDTGDDVVLGARVDGTTYFTSVTPSGDGALVAWFSLDDAPTSSWRTRSLGFDGATRSPERTHLSFASSQGVFTGLMSLASERCRFAGLVDDPANGCRLLPLDGEGAETGAPVTLASNATCETLGAIPGGFSFVRGTSDGQPPYRLDTVGLDGAARTSRALPTAVNQAIGARLVRRDGTFLLAGFGETSQGGLLTTTQAFSPEGAPLGESFEITDMAGSVLRMAETPGGALAVWTGWDTSKRPNGGISLFVITLAADGKPTGPPTPLAAPGAAGQVYGFDLAASPDGGALLAWYENEPTNHSGLHALALGPDGAPRGPATSFGTFESITAVGAIVSPDGRRALVLYAGERDGASGMHAVPVTCAD